MSAQFLKATKAWLDYVTDGDWKLLEVNSKTLPNFHRRVRLITRRPLHDDIKCELFQIAVETIPPYIKLSWDFQVKERTR